MTRSNFEERSVLNFTSGERVHCSTRVLDDLIFQASRASSVVVERHAGRLRPSMSRFGSRLEAMGSASKKMADDCCSELRPSQLAALYLQICSEFDVHALSGVSADEETLCVVFADPSMLEYDAWLQKTGNVLRIVMP